MIPVDLALALRAAGLRWNPEPGDRFVLPNRGMDEDTFVLSDMTVQVHEFPSATVIGFNGVTEWALDSVDRDEAVWLPAEHQLRSLLGGFFVRLERTGQQWAVRYRLEDQEQTSTADTAEEAYGSALLMVLHEVSGQDPADPVASW